jgi:hypothetical protein
MALLPAADWLRTSPPFLRVLLALLVAAVAVPSSQAQDNVYYSPKTGFRIPFQVDPGDRRVRDVLLHVSEDLGRTYRAVASARPGDHGFNFQANHDGWYYFTVQTRDQDNRLYPASVAGAAPGLKVYVDTTPPDVVLRPMAGGRPNEVGVEWDIRDDMLDVGSLRLEYRGRGQVWTRRGVPQVPNGQLSWDPGVPGPIEVRLQVKDRAGNVGEKSLVLRDDGSGPVRRPDDPGPRGTLPPSGIRKVNSVNISLNYKIDDVGPSDVSTVEVWVRKDGGTWQKYPKEAGRQGPFVVEVEGEGKYGFSLVAKSGVGLGENPPRGSDQPQVWVEVDLTKPKVEISDVVVGRGADTGNLTVRWVATDKNMSPQPISIYFADKPEGPWRPVPGASNLPNTGTFVWRMQDNLPYQFYVRVEAIDEAGNIGTADTRETVKVDLSLPKARVIGIDPVKPGS